MEIRHLIFLFGLNLGLEWNNFDFNAFFQGVGKQYMVREGDFGVCPLGAVYQNQNRTYLIIPGLLKELMRNYL